MYLYGGNTTWEILEKLISHLGWGLTCKTEEWWVQRLCSLTVKVWSHKFCVHMIQTNSETIIRYFLTTQGFVIVFDRPHLTSHFSIFIQMLGITGAQSKAVHTSQRQLQVMKKISSFSCHREH